ncbi:hypothetical protein NE237_011194 [Protea cynaroides]|uniref:UspA domain-containing protein n=1 Tax=Protea cynaroides TaxID=273540 RepID=A0A9Q0GUH5_9MAGN|nr:hypothetical protein NE237_011194 [Protea cynaroides]
MEVATGEPKKVMVVANLTRESANALQWVLSHAVLEKDELFLLHVEQPISWLNTIRTFLRRRSSPVFVATNSLLEGSGDREVDFVDLMKHACEIAEPKVRVHIERVEIDHGKDKASIILSKSRMFSIDLLVIGQRRRHPNAILRGLRIAFHPQSPVDNLRNYVKQKFAPHLIHMPSMLTTTFETSRCKLNGMPTKGIDTAEYLIENSKCKCVGVQKKGHNGYLLNTKKQRNFWLLA